MGWRAWRERAGLRQDAVARRLNVSRAHYSRLETGMRNMDLKVARRLATLLGLSAEEKAALLTDEQMEDAA